MPPREADPGLRAAVRLTFLAPRAERRHLSLLWDGASSVGRNPYLERRAAGPLARDPLYAGWRTKEVNDLPAAAQLLFAAEPDGAGPPDQDHLVLCDLAATGLLLSCSSVSSCPPPGLIYAWNL